MAFVFTPYKACWLEVGCKAVFMMLVHCLLDLWHSEQLDFNIHSCLCPLAFVVMASINSSVLVTSPGQSHLSVGAGAPGPSLLLAA